MRETTMAAMEAVEALLRDGKAHSASSVMGCLKASSRSVADGILDKLAAIGVVELFHITHRQEMMGGYKRLVLKCARKTDVTLASAIGQQALDLGGDVTFRTEHEAVIGRLKSLVLTRFPKTKNVQSKQWPATKLSWHRSLERVERIDKITWAEQLEVLTWLTSSSSRDAKFWGGQIRSAESWRKHYPSVHGVFLSEQGQTTAGIDDAWAKRGAK